MAPTATTPLKRNKKVYALADLPGVPRGTQGKVLMVGGVSWKRYWVDFENGVSMPAVDRAEIGTKDEWERHQAGPVVTAAATTSSTATAAAAEPEGEAVGGIPFHLLERSRRARERLTAKD